MSLSELKKFESEISETKSQIQHLHKESITANKKLATLQKIKSELELSLFLEYLPLGYEIQITNNGHSYQIGTYFNGSPYFNSGDIIKVFKKNKKSIVIKRVKKLITDKSLSVSIGQFAKTVIDCDENYRIEVSGLYHYLMSLSAVSGDFKKQFYSYLTRKESLENLGL